MFTSLVINSQIEINRSELRFTFVRSSGPGGQNVNKVNSKAVMRWNVAASANLPPAVRQRFVNRYRLRIAADGSLVLTSERYRDQARNIADCLDKLRAMILDVAAEPRQRKATRPSRASVKRRLERKREQSERKKGRRPPRRDD